MLEGRIGSLLAAACVAATCVGCGASDTPALGSIDDGDELREQAAPGPAAPWVDGQLDDWAGVSPLAVDALGDARGAFDVTAIYATSRGSRLWLRLDTQGVLNLYNGAASDGSMRIDVTLPSGDELQIDLRGRRTLLGSAPAAPLSWRELELRAAPSFAAREFELRMDLQRFGVTPGSELRIGVAGSDDVDPKPFMLVHRPAPRRVASAARHAATEVRIASLNTLEGRLLRGNGAEAQGRLLRAAAADVYCLQELGPTSASELEERFASIDPRADGKPWNAHTTPGNSVIGNAVVSQSPLIPIETGTARFAAAVVQLDRPGPIVAVSAHLTCCGFAGSPEDAARMAETAALGQLLTQLRRAALGDALEPFAGAPVMLVGDFNHVGSAAVLETLTERRSHGLLHWPLVHLAGIESYSWRSDESSFPPSALDVLLHGPRLDALSGWLLDTHDLLPQELTALGLQRDDSLASDHRLLVADFRQRAR